MAAGKQLNFQVMRINHKEKVTEALESMFLDESLTDVTICCCGQQVKAHRVILAASSNYFKEIFASTLPGQYPIVFIKSVTIEDLNSILEFMYKGELTVPQDRMESLVSSAECLGVSGLGTMDIDDQIANLHNGRPIRPELALLNERSSAASSPSRSDANSEDGQKNDTSKTTSSTSSSTMPKKRGKKRKIAAEEEQNQKVEKSNNSLPKKTESNGVHSSSPQSTASSSSSSTHSTRKSVQSQASTSMTNGHHKVSSVSKRNETAPDPMDEAEDEATDNEAKQGAEELSSARTRKNSMVKNKSKRLIGARARGEMAHEHNSRTSTPSLDSDIEIDISNQYGSKLEGHRTSNGSLDLSRKSTSSKLAADSGEMAQNQEDTSSQLSNESSSAPGTKTPITKSKLRSWSQQISQSAGPVAEQTPAGPKGLGVSKPIPHLNLTAIKNEINEQLFAGSASNSPSTLNGASPNVFSAKMTTSPEDEKPVITLPPHIKMEARPRGRPRKAITEKAAVVPRPLNPLLGLARSSLAAKVAKTVAAEAAATASANASANVTPTATPTKESSAATSVESASVTEPATPVVCAVAPAGASTPSNGSANKSSNSTLESATPALPVMRVSRLSPSTSHTVTIVNGSGHVLSTMTAGVNPTSSSPHSPALSSASSSSSSDMNVEQMTTTAAGSSRTSTSNSLPVIKKRRGRPPSVGHLPNLKLVNILPKPEPKPEPKVPSLTLKISNQFAHMFKPKLSAGVGSSSSSSTASSSLGPLHQSNSVITSFFGASSSSTPTFTSAASSASIPLSLKNPSSSAHAPVQARPSSAQTMTTIRSDSSPLQGGHDFPVPRFTPIAVVKQESTEKSNEQASPKIVAV